MASKQNNVFGSSHSILGVMDMAKEHINKVPSNYIRPEKEPAIIPSDEITSFPKIPVVDLQTLVSGEAKDFELDKLYSTCKDWGFFQVFLPIYIFFS